MDAEACLLFGLTREAVKSKSVLTLLKPQGEWAARRRLGEGTSAPPPRHGAQLAACTRQCAWTRNAVPLPRLLLQTTAWPMMRAARTSLVSAAPGLGRGRAATWRGTLNSLLMMENVHTAPYLLHLPAGIKRSQLKHTADASVSDKQGMDAQHADGSSIAVQVQGCDRHGDGSRCGGVVRAGSYGRGLLNLQLRHLLLVEERVNAPPSLTFSASQPSPIASQVVAARDGGICAARGPAAPPPAASAGEHWHGAPRQQRERGGGGRPRRHAVSCPGIGRMERRCPETVSAGTAATAA